MSSFFNKVRIALAMIFESCFMTLDDAILHDDVDGFIRGNAEFQGILGGKAQFSSFNEFDGLMRSDEDFVF